MHEMNKQLEVFLIFQFPHGRVHRAHIPAMGRHCPYKSYSALNPVVVYTLSVGRRTGCLLFMYKLVLT